MAMLPQMGAAAESLNKASSLVMRIGTDAHLYDDPDNVNMRPLLDSRYDSEKVDTLKRLHALIAQDADVSNFFPQKLRLEYLPDDDNEAKLDDILSEPEPEKWLLVTNLAPPACQNECGYPLKVPIKQECCCCYCCLVLAIGERLCCHDFNRSGN